jgi:PAS domain-containing protein
MLVVGFDITQRKQAETELRKSEARLRESEDRFSRAFRASPALMAISRLSDGKFVEANDAFVRWFRLDREGILGCDSQELGICVNHDDRVKFLGNLRRKGSLREVELRYCAGRNVAAIDSIAIPGVSKYWPPNNKTNNIQLHPGISTTAYSL